MSKEEKPNSHILDGLMDRRTVVLGGEISHALSSDVAQRLISLQLQSNNPINLVIDSVGGNMDAALRLCDLMSTMLTAPVRGIALGDCGSAATFVMLYCKERVGTPFSRFLIHSGTFSEIAIPINQTTTEHLEQLLREVKSTEEKVTDLYSNHLTPMKLSSEASIGERRSFVRELFARGDQRFDDWMSAQEAVKIGLIEHVVTEKLGIFQS